LMIALMSAYKDTLQLLISLMIGYK